MSESRESALTTIVRPSLIWLALPFAGAALFATFDGPNVTTWADHLLIAAVGFTVPALLVLGYGSRIRASSRRIRLERVYGVAEVEWTNIERIEMSAGNLNGRGLALMVRIAPKGDTWAAPGPNAPHLLWMGLISGRRAERAAREIESMAAPFGIPVKIDIY